ncbi:hypothetical protein CP02DC24_1069A, partial [Chlamydia psittaci 02DC24]
MGIDEINS